VSYEVPLPKPELLRERPMDAAKLMRYLVDRGLRPIAVTVDNAGGKVFAYFAEPLSRDRAKELMELVLDYYRKHVGLKGE